MTWRPASGTSVRPAPDGNALLGRRRWRRPDNNSLHLYGGRLVLWVALHAGVMGCERRERWRHPPGRRCRCRSGQARNAPFCGRAWKSRWSLAALRLTQAMCFCSGLTTARGPGTRGASCRQARPDELRKRVFTTRLGSFRQRTFQITSADFRGTYAVDAEHSAAEGRTDGRHFRR